MTLRILELDTSWGSLKLSGGSRAGEGTLILLPQLRLALDPGRAHRALPPMNQVCVSHGHHDHAGGLAYWASQRLLNSMGPAKVYAPGAIADNIRQLLLTAERLEGGRPYDATVEPVENGDSIVLRADMHLHFFSTDHWVPTLGSRIVWHRRHLRDEFTHLTSEEIAKLRRSGKEVTEEIEVVLLTYCADTGPALFTDKPWVLDSEILLVECSFYRDSDRQRAAEFGHMHIAEVTKVARQFEGRHLVLLHPSRRNRLREVEQQIDERIRPVCSATVDHMMVDWE
ncbi:MAG: MBL fold metallo-hydrolase [bacterium]|nr:MBL fold metallo-hydrolase [bacterium]